MASENEQKNEKRETVADVVAKMVRESIIHVSIPTTDLKSYADRLEAAWKREREELDKRISDLEAYAKLWTDRADELRLKCDEFYAKANPVGNAAAWEETCAKCRDGIEPRHCEYYGEPNGCNSPTYGEHPPVGNAAAMREALVILTRFAEVDIRGLENLAKYAIDHSMYGGGILQAVAGAIREGKNALAKPSRNCDVGTAEEQAERYHATGKVYHIPTLTNVLDWAQMPYAEEGGAK